MQLIHRLQSSHQFDCFSVNWKWIFTSCCSFSPDGSSHDDVNQIEQRTLLSDTKEVDDVYGSVIALKNLSADLGSLASSIPASEEDRKPNWRDLEDLQPAPVTDNVDVVTIAGEDYIGRDKYMGKDEENRSDYFDDKIPKFGTVVVSFKYEMMRSILSIEIANVTHLPKIDGPSMYQLFVKIFKDDARSQKKWHSPMFVAQSFPSPQVIEHTDISPKDMSGTAIRIRLYGCERKRRDMLVSESIIGLQNVDLHRTEKYHIRLEQREKVKLKSNAEIADEADKPANDTRIIVDEQVGNQQELQVGLCYNAVTGRLSIEIRKGNGLKNPLTRSILKLPNPFVKITLCDKNGQQIAKSKTTVRPNQANPLFNETFIFQVPQFQLDEVTIILGVYHKKSANRKELIGWSSVGCHSSSENESCHWSNMKDNKGTMTRSNHLLQDNAMSRHGFPGAD